MTVLDEEPEDELWAAVVVVVFEDELLPQAAAISPTVNRTAPIVAAPRRRLTGKCGVVFETELAISPLSSLGTRRRLRSRMPDIV